MTRFLQEFLKLLPISLIVGILIGAFVSDKIFFKKEAWDPGPIYYYNDSGYDQTLKMAVRAWNRVRLPVYFKETRNKIRADFVIGDNRDILVSRCGNCVGHASLGKQSEAYVDLLPARDVEGEVVDFLRLPVIVHELGHVLGSGHNNGPCSVMNVESFCWDVAKKPKITKKGSRLFCGPWKSDIDYLARFYNLKTKPVVNPVCRDQQATISYWTSHYRS